MTSDLRDLYRSHEYLVDGASDRLLPAVRQRRRRAQVKARIGYASVALIIVATIGGAVAFGSVHSAHRIQVGKPNPAQTAPAGYRLESSLGVQIAVPADWQTNDFGCTGDARPSVVRAPGLVPLCLRPIPATKEFAIISVPGDAIGAEATASIGADVSHLVTRSITLDGVAASRADGTISGARFAGWISVPERNVSVVVRTNSRSELTTILDSTHLVAVDHFGCASTAPPPLRPQPSAGPTFVDAAPSAVSVCYYAARGVLETSSRRTGAAAVAVATALNAAAPGANPNRPDLCVHSAGPQNLDAVLVIYRADGSTQTVNLTFRSCVDVHLDNGREYRHVTFSLLKVIMEGIDSGYGGDAGVLN